jgi:hypothetical protein
MAQFGTETDDAGAFITGRASSSGCSGSTR